jgi:hypothetical protein
MRVPALVPIVSPAQFVHEILEARGQARRFGAEALLQRLTDALADRPAGRAVNRMAAFAAVPIHDEFRLFPGRSVLRQIFGPEIVSGHVGIACNCR